MSITLNITLGLITVLMASCRDKEYPQIGNCDLEYLDGTMFSGYLHYCHGQNQEDVKASALLEVSDSFFIFTVQSTDPQFNYLIKDTAQVKCIYQEGNENYDLLNPDTISQDMGHLGEKGGKLLLKILRNPCINSTVFDGDKL